MNNSRFIFGTFTSVAALAFMTGVGISQTTTTGGTTPGTTTTTGGTTPGTTTTTGGTTPGTTTTTGGTTPGTTTTTGATTPGTTPTISPAFAAGGLFSSNTSVILPSVTTCAAPAGTSCTGFPLFTAPSAVDVPGTGIAGATTTFAGDTLTLVTPTGGTATTQVFDLTTAVQYAEQFVSVRAAAPVGGTTTGGGATTGTTATTTATAGTPSDSLILFKPTAGNELSFLNYGVWAHTASDGATTFGAFAAGQETLPADLPKIGTAAYTGSTIGTVSKSGTGTFNVIGSSALSANFGTGAVTASFTGLTAAPGGSVATGTPWSSITGTASLTAGTSRFAGTAASSTTTAIQSESLSGSLKGAFYGPAAAEVGGTWALNGATSHAVGAFGAKK